MTVEVGAVKRAFSYDALRSAFVDDDGDMVVTDEEIRSLEGARDGVLAGHLLRNLGDRP